MLVQSMLDSLLTLLRDVILCDRLRQLKLCVLCLQLDAFGRFGGSCRMPAARVIWATTLPTTPCGMYMHNTQNCHMNVKTIFDEIFKHLSEKKKKR
jgi:hypothetical protein